MARHLEQQASELPALKIRPQSVFLLVYPGGHCGEFLSWWLGLHPGCVRTQVRGIENNRYVWQPSYRYEYSERGTRDKLFLAAHPGNTVSKCGLTVSDSQQHIFLYSDAKYRHFFYYLFLIKNYFSEFRVEQQQPPSITTEQWHEFLKYLNGRDSYYLYELECWVNNDFSTFRNSVYTGWDRINSPGGPSIQLRFDIGEMFFGNTEQHAQKLLKDLTIRPNPKLSYYLPEYHQRNIAVVEKHSNMKIDQFLDLDIDQALEVMANSYKGQHFS